MPAEELKKPDEGAMARILARHPYSPEGDVYKRQVSASVRSARSSTAPALKIGQNSREFCPHIALLFAPHGAGEQSPPFLFFTFL